MARGHQDLPSKVLPIILNKLQVFQALKDIDSESAARERVLKMETDFRKRIRAHLGGLPTVDASFVKFNTSPFVIMFYSKQKGYKSVSQVEKDIVPAKVFSSMETSAGRMIEEVVLPVYGWECVQSSMSSTESVIDGQMRSQGNGVYRAVTLKSGPRCLNDEMAKDIGTDVAANIRNWAQVRSFKAIDFTYGVLYGTKKISNKKDWHVIRNIAENLPGSSIVKESHRNRWGINYSFDNIEVSANVRVGLEWWTYLGGSERTYLEICIALIRACIEPANGAASQATYTIKDLASILDLRFLPDGYNISLLQESQFEWLLFLVRHFADGFDDAHAPLNLNSLFA